MAGNLTLSLGQIGHTNLQVHHKCKGKAEARYRQHRQHIHTHHIHLQHFQEKTVASVGRVSQNARKYLDLTII